MEIITLAILTCPQSPFPTPGLPLTQLPDRFPMLKYVYTNFEYTYQATPGVNFAKSFWALPVVLVTFYMAAIFFGTK